MALMLPKARGITRESNVSGQPTTSMGTAVTSDSVANQFPTDYTELIASTSYDTDWVRIWLHTNSGTVTDSDSLVTIYVGAGTAEQELIPYLLAGWVPTPSAANAFVPRLYEFPLRIPAGSRLSARHQSVRTSQAVTVVIELFGGGGDTHWTGTRVEAVGVDSANSTGTYVTAGTAAEGTLTSIGTNSYEWGYVVPMMGGHTDTTTPGGFTFADLASTNSTANLIGGLDNFLFASSTAEWSGAYQAGRYCTIPASTTLYLRSQHSASTEAEAFCIYGVH